LVDAQGVHPERFVLSAVSILGQGVVKARRYLNELIITQYSMMIFGRAPVVGQRVIAVKSARSLKRPDVNAAIEKMLLPSVANKLSTAFPDIQESNVVIRRKRFMELSLPPVSVEGRIGNTVIRGGSIEALPQHGLGGRSGPRPSRFPQSAPCS
jgi:hypothetical protein